MNIKHGIMRRVSMLINKFTGGTAQNQTGGTARGEAFPGMAEAARKAAADGSVLLFNRFAWAIMAALSKKQGAFCKFKREEAEDE